MFENKDGTINAACDKCGARVSMFCGDDKKQLADTLARFGWKIDADTGAAVCDLCARSPQEERRAE